MALYLFGGMVVFSIVLIAYALWPKSNDEGEAVKRRMAGKRAQDAVSAVRQLAKDSVAKKVMETVAPIAARKATTENAESMS